MNEPVIPEALTEDVFQFVCDTYGLLDDESDTRNMLADVLAEALAFRDENGEPWLYLFKQVWVCPDCAFTFDAVHTDVGGGYSCPACGELALSARLAQVEAERDAALVERDAWKADRNEANDFGDRWRAIANAQEARCRELEAALRIVEDARQYARRCVGSLPVEMGQHFESRQDEADRAARAVLAAPQPVEEDQ